MTIGAGEKIIERLKDAIAGNFSRVTMEGQTWVRVEPDAGWRQIETAPKDGRTILGWWNKSQILSPIYWDREWLDRDDSCPISQPTHWLEIPQPPGWLPEHH